MGKMLTTSQRKAFLKDRIRALTFLVNDSLFKDLPDKHRWLKSELDCAKHCLKDKHYL